MVAMPLWLAATFMGLGIAALSGAFFALVKCDHPRTCTGKSGCISACRLNRTSSAPATTCIDMRDDSTSTVRTPSDAFDESVECADSCKQVPSASCRGSTGSKCFEFFSSMPEVSGAR